MISPQNLYSSFLSYAHFNIFRGCLHEASWPGGELISILLRSHLLGQMHTNYHKRLHENRAGPLSRDLAFALPRSRQNQPASDEMTIDVRLDGNDKETAAMLLEKPV